MMLLEEQVINDDTKLLVEKFLDQEKLERYILGRNKNAQILASHVKIIGFIDDFTTEAQWMNKPIFKSLDLPNKDTCIVVSCSLAIYPHSARTSLRKNGFKNILDYLEVSKYSQNKNLQVQFIDDAKQDIEKNYDKYDAIFDKIKDKASRKVYLDLMNFRKNMDLRYLSEYKVNPIRQYFEDFLNLGYNEVFVDAGSFDGTTSVEFIKHCPKYKSIYILEPSEKNLVLAKHNLKDYENIYFIAKGLSNQKDTLKFNTTAGSASSISENGNVTIAVDTLDNLVREKVTFIKMDIEGSEGLAVEGMKHHILNEHPKMAISVYHKVDDLWKIPEQIFAIREDYDIYIRHYTEGTDETIMFFIPKGKI